ncbi:MAG: MFS transporter, partial [Acidobacteria bacterium]|nr:MFS transporter [Acidobacteriota bacterium]
MNDSKPMTCVEPVPLIDVQVENERADVRLIAYLAAGHLVVDVTQGALPAFLPFLKSAHQLSYAAAAGIVLAANVSSSIIQPMFGYLADRASRRWVLPASVMIAGIGLALTGIATSYPALLALVVFMGLGVAA